MPGMMPSRGIEGDPDPPRDVRARTMRLTPYASVDSTTFATRRSDLLAARGAPERCSRNAVGLSEMDYGDAVFRFQDNGRLEEITQQAPVLHLGAVAIPFAALDRFVREHDPAAFERAGFVVSPAFGIAFDPQCPSWVTALAAHAIDAWRALGG